MARSPPIIGLRCRPEEGSELAAAWLGLGPGLGSGLRLGLGLGLGSGLRLGLGLRVKG